MDPSMLVGQLGPAAAFLGLLIWLGRLYYSGKLVPRATLIDMKENFSQQIAREREISDNWQKIASNNTEALGKLSSQVEKLSEGQRTVETFILSLSQNQSRQGLTSGTGGIG